MTAALGVDLRSDLPPVAQFAVELEAEPRNQELERLLNIWRRVLLQSILEYWLAPPSSVRFKEALEWLFYSDQRAANSFSNVCLALGMNATQVRAMVARRRSEFSMDPSKVEGVVLAMKANGFRVPNE